MSDDSAPVRWEYLAIPESERDRLANLGDEGWELVSVGGGPGEPTLYLKRPAASFRERVTLQQREHYLARVGATPDRERQP